MSSNDKPQARLEDWFVGPHDLLYGKVYGHPKFKDGEAVVTSRVVTFDPATGTATTRNTNYLLGAPLEKSKAK